MITPEQLDILSDAIDPDDIIMITKSSDGETKVIPAGAIVPITGTCESAASDSTKIIVLTEFSGTELPKHFYVNVIFANGNTYGDTTTTPATYPTLQFQNKDGVNVDTPYSLCDSRGHYAGTGCYNSGDKMKLECEDHNASIQNSDIRQQVNSSTNGYTIMSDGRIEHSTTEVFWWESDAIYSASGDHTVGSTQVFDEIIAVKKGSYLVFADIPCYVNNFTGGFDLVVDDTTYEKKTNSMTNNNLTFAKILRIDSDKNIHIKLFVKMWAASGAATCYFSNYSTKTVKLSRLN